MRRHQLAINGKTMLQSDEHTARIIFNNLSGENYKQLPGDPMPPALLTGSHESYIAAMSHEFKMTIAAGDELTLLAPDGKAIIQATVSGELSTNETEHMERQHG